MITDYPSKIHTLTHSIDSFYTFKVFPEILSALNVKWTEISRGLRQHGTQVTYEGIVRRSKKTEHSLLYLRLGVQWSQFAFNPCIAERV